MTKPHAVCVPYPAQGHITPMMKLAKLLHAKGFHVTFVNTEYNHRRMLRSHAAGALEGLPDFCFRTIPDGLPLCDGDATQDVPSLCQSTMTNCLAPFKKLISELNAVAAGDGAARPVSCIISDGVMSFALDAARDTGVPCVLLWTASACGFMGYLNYRILINKGLVPLKDVDQLTNGFLDTVVDWLPGMADNIRLKNQPSFLRTMDANDIMLNFALHETERAHMAPAYIINTFDELERPALDAMAAIIPKVVTVGPLLLHADHLPDGPVYSLKSNLWTEQFDCLDWLSGRKPGSVVYVNYGSVTVMTNEQLLEFAWGLANSEYEFLWIIRPDLVRGDTAVLPPEFLKAIKGRGLLETWCPQEEVLRHEAVGLFLTHSGWNSTLESLSNGVPMLTWPFFAEQQTNSWYACNIWGVGMEVGADVRRSSVEGLIREAMDGEKGKEMKKKAKEWKELAEAATQPGGASYANLEKVINGVLLSKEIAHL